MIDQQKMYDIIETDIMDNFDFNQVHKVMEFLEWQWFDAGEASQSGVPDVSTIRKKARYLLRQAGDKLLTWDKDNLPEFSIATGGLHATAYRDKELGIVFFKLTFEIESWDNFD